MIFPSIHSILVVVKYQMQVSLNDFPNYAIFTKIQLWSYFSSIGNIKLIKISYQERTISKLDPLILFWQFFILLDHILNHFIKPMLGVITNLF